MSAVVSILLSQSSSLEVSQPSNMVMSCRMDIMRFICSCAAHRMSVYYCIAVCMGSSRGLSVGHGCSPRANFCSFGLGVQASQCLQVYSGQLLGDHVFPEIARRSLAVVPDLFEW